MFEPVSATTLLRLYPVYYLVISTQQSTPIEEFQVYDG